MCTRYISPKTAAIERAWHVGRSNPWRWPMPIDLFPGYQGPLLRGARDSTEPRPKLTREQWNLMPLFAKEPRLNHATCNAWSEELADKASYKLPYARGKRCIIRAALFSSRTGSQASTSDGRLSALTAIREGLAGMWNTWIDRATGEVHES